MIFKDTLTVYSHPKMNFNFLMMNTVYKNLRLHHMHFPQHLLICQPLQHLSFCVLHASKMLMRHIHLDRQEEEQQFMGRSWV